MEFDNILGSFARQSPTQFLDAFHSLQERHLILSALSKSAAGLISGCHRARVVFLLLRCRAAGLLGLWSNGALKLAERILRWS